MSNPYDLSAGGGLRTLALLEKARNKRMSARHLRATAAAYTDEEEWVHNSRATAKKLECEAECLEHQARERR